MTDKQEILDIPQHLRRDTVTDEVQAMLNAINVMDSQSALITKLESKLKDREMLYEAGITAAREEIAEADDATSQAQARFERAEKVIEKLREVVPKLVEVAEGGS